MRGFSIKGTKEQKSWIKLIQDIRGLVKVFIILASTESLVLTGNYFLAFSGVSMVCELCIFKTW